LLDPETRGQLAAAAEQSGSCVAISALQSEGLEPLLTLIDRELSSGRRIITPKINLSDGATIAWLYRHGEVLNRSDDDSFAHFRVSLTPADAERLGRRRRSGAHGRNLD